MERKFDVKVAYLFEKMHRKALELKEIERANNLLVSSFDETNTNDPTLLIVESYNTDEKVITELMQNAYDAHSKHVAVINKIDSDELNITSNNSYCIYNIIANDGDALLEKDINIYASIPGKTTKKVNEKTIQENCGGYGFGASYRFFQPTLTFAYNPIENCCHVIYTSPENLLQKNNENYLPIVVEKLEGSFCELVNMNEDEFCFKPSFITVFKNNKYLNPNYILVNQNFKKYALESVACNFKTIDTSVQQTYLKVMVDLVSIPGSCEHQMLFDKSSKYSNEKLTFTCFARPYDEEKLQIYLDKHKININYECLSGTEELEKLNDILLENNYPTKYKFYHAEPYISPETGIKFNRYSVIFMGDETAYSGQNLVTIRTTKSNGVERRQLQKAVGNTKRGFNNIYRARMGRPCMFNMSVNTNLFITNLSEFFSKPEDFVRIIINDDSLKENINRTSFCEEKAHHMLFFKNEVDKIRDHLKRDFSELIKRLNIPKHDTEEYVRKTQKKYIDTVKEVEINVPDYMSVSNNSFEINALSAISDPHEDHTKTLFHLFYTSNGLNLKERFAMPLISLGSKEVNIDYLGIDFSKACADYDDEKFKEIQEDKTNFKEELKYLLEEYRAVIEFESSLSHFFDHKHSIQGLTHIVTGDIEGIKLGEIFELKNRPYTAILEKSKKRNAKARYVLSIIEDCGTIHKIDVLCMKERLSMLLNETK